MNQTDDALNVAVRDLRNRSRGMLAEMMGRLSEDGADDLIITERVRAELGRLVRYPGSLQVTSENGKIRLQGPVLASDADSLVRRVAAVRGVTGVDNQLSTFQTMEEMPAQVRAMNATAGMQNQPAWSPSLRLISSMGGGLLMLYGLARRGLVGTALSVTGLGLATRGVANAPIKELLGMDGARDVIRVNKAINIQAPIDEVYAFWSKLENLPRFMAHLKEVRNLGNGRTHWVATGPVGKQTEWDAITTREIPNQMIAWESVAGSEVKTSGMVRFDENGDGSTRVTVHLNYTPPAGVIGHAVASLLGADPKTAMDEDLARLKTLFEEGKTSVDGQEKSLPENGAD
jgi:uncharacterized membrane protein